MSLHATPATSARAVDPARAGPAYRPDIDGLRAVAVVAVVLCHAFPRRFPGGFVGVDVFFVISGYLISGLLADALQARAFSLPRFYARRVRRLLPALALVLGVGLLVGWAGLFRSEWQSLGRHTVAGVLFSENVLLAREAGYFDAAAAAKPLLHLWSLGVEEQFYLAWPVLLWGAHRCRLGLLPLAVGLGVASLAYGLVLARADPVAAYYSALGRAWELMLGAALAGIERHHPAGLARHASLRGWLGLGLLAAGFALVRPGPGGAMPCPGAWAGLPTLGAALVLSGGRGGQPNRLLLARPPMVGIGLVSYALYLWHWPLLAFAHLALGPLLPRGLSVALVALAGAAAVGSFFLLERRFRLPPGRPDAPAGLQMRGLLVAVGLVLAGGATAATGWFPPRLDAFQEAADVRRETAFWARHQLPSGDAPAPDALYGLAAGRPRRVLLIGDSHLTQYYRRLATAIAARPAGPGVVASLGPGCLPIPGVAGADPAVAPCPARVAQAYVLARSGAYPRVVIGAGWNFYFLADPGRFTLEVGGRRLGLDTPAGRRAALARLAETLASLGQAGRQVVLVLDNPMPGAAATGGWRTRLGPAPARGYPPDMAVAADPRQLALREELRALATRAGAVVVDPWPSVCPGAGRRCRVTDATGRPVFRDFGHLDADWAAAHAMFIDAALGD